MAIPYKQETLPQVATIDFDVTGWYGLNRRKGNLASGEMYDAKNMSSDKYPYSSPRAPREKILSGIENPQNLFTAGGKLGYIANGNLYFADEGTDFEEKGAVGTTTSICDFNGVATFFPSNRAYDYTKQTELTNLSTYSVSEGFYAYDYKMWDSFYEKRKPQEVIEDKNICTYSHSTVPLICKSYDGSLVGSNFPDYRTAYMYRLSEPIPVTARSSITFVGSGISENGKIVTDYYGSEKENKLYVKLYVIPYTNDGKCKKSILTNIFEEIEFGKPYKVPEDVETLYVNIGYRVGVCKDANNRKEAEKSMQEDYEKLSADPAEAHIWLSDIEYPEVGGVPHISYATVDNNRIFAVSGNDIYASCQGNAGNWTDFASTSNPLGAYAETMNTPGDFIQVVKYLGRCILFKNDLVYQSYNNEPPYQILEISKTGCIDGKSVCEVGSVLYYLGRDGIYSFTGGFPKLISENLNKEYVSGTAGTDGRKYYISVFDGKEYELLVYDTFTGFWQCEDNLNVVGFAFYDGFLYALTAEGELLKFGAGTERVKWEFTTQDYTFALENTKNVKKMYVRCDMDAQTELEVYVKRNDGEWSRVAYYQADGQTMFDFKVRIKKCDTFALKFKGKGYVNILDIHAKITQGTAKHRSGKNLSVFRQS